MKFETEKHYNRTTRIKDMEYSGPTEVRLTHFANEGDKAPYSLIVINTGAASLHVRITPTEARDLATNLQAHAEEFEAHQAQFERDGVPA